MARKSKGGPAGGATIGSGSIQSGSPQKSPTNNREDARSTQYSSQPKTNIKTRISEINVSGILGPRAQRGRGDRKNKKITIRVKRKMKEHQRSIKSTLAT